MFCYFYQANIDYRVDTSDLTYSAPNLCMRTVMNTVGVQG